MKCISISILAILLYISTAGQLAFTNTGNLQIHTGVSVTGFGSFVNSSAAVFVNNANFYLKGNLTNDQPAMSAGTAVCKQLAVLKHLKHIILLLIIVMVLRLIIT